MFLSYVDQRSVAQLVSDTGAPVTLASLPTDPNLAAALLRAQGRLELYAIRGTRYQPADLAALTGAGQAAMYDVLTRLTMVYLYQRRPDLEVSEFYKSVQEDLKTLSDGEWVFGLLQSQEAGISSHHVETPAEVWAREGIAVVAHRLYGRRTNQLNPCPGGPSGGWRYGGY